MTIEPEDVADELSFRTTLGKTYCSLESRPLQSLTETLAICAISGSSVIDGVAANAARFFDIPSNLRNQLPTFGFDSECNQDFIDTSTVTLTSPFPDPTFNNVLPGMLQEELLQRLKVGPIVDVMGYFDFYPLQTKPGTTTRGFASILVDDESELPQLSLKVSDVSLQDGAFFSLEQLPATSPITLCDPGDQLFFQIAFSSTAEGGYTDTLIIDSNDVWRPRVEILLKGCTGSIDDCDNDGVPDTQDACPLDNVGGSVDTDGDGLCDGRDPDDDNDGVLDPQDAFPTDPNEWVDTDRDGIGNNADPDDDNDGMSDVEELARGRNPLFNEGTIGSFVPLLLSD